MLWEGMIWKEQSERCVMEKEARNPLGSQKVYFLRGYFTCGKYPGNGENIGN